VGTSSSSNPQITLLRERVNDLEAYLEMWDQRSAATDQAAARAAGSAAIERISATAMQLADMSKRLLAELKAFDDGVKVAGDPLLNVRRHDEQPWTDTGTNPGYPAGDEPQPEA
jgi:hypothetical protein